MLVHENDNSKSNAIGRFEHRCDFYRSVGEYISQKGCECFFADFALKEFSVDSSLKLISDPLQTILVSENAECIDGLVRLSSNSTPPVSGCSNMEIATLYVQPPHHDKGIGKGLLSAALKYFCNLDVDSVWWTTNAGTHPAIAFLLLRALSMPVKPHLGLATMDI